MPALRATFVWDDTALVLRDPLIRSWRLIPEGFHHFLFSTRFFKFLSTAQRLLTRWNIDVRFRPGPYHFTNILLHAVAAIASRFRADAAQILRNR